MTADPDRRLHGNAGLGVDPARTFRPRTGPENKDLLSVPLRALRIDLASSFFAAGLAALDHELRRAGIVLRPRFYLCTGYGCVVRTANVGLLFTDAVPPLRRLARNAGLRVRSRREIRRTLRHEMGHAFCYTHRLYATRRFRDLFGVVGNFYDTYPDRWRPTREARARVARGDLVGVYAARHADEDFAMCFQTWLANPEGCVAPYARRPRIVEKLAYVAEVAQAIGARPVASDPDDLDQPIDAANLTLGAWFKAVQRANDYNLFPKGPVA